MDIVERLRAHAHRASSMNEDMEIEAADTIERLRAELAEANGRINRCVDQNKYLESQLTEARKPDCRMCVHSTVNDSMNAFECGFRSSPCIAGNRFLATDPVRLYEKEGK